MASASAGRQRLHLSLVRAAQGDPRPLWQRHPPHPLRRHEGRCHQHHHARRPLDLPRLRQPAPRHGSTGQHGPYDVVHVRQRGTSPDGHRPCGEGEFVHLRRHVQPRRDGQGRPRHRLPEQHLQRRRPGPAPDAHRGAGLLLRLHPDRHRPDHRDRGDSAGRRGPPGGVRRLRLRRQRHRGLRHHAGPQDRLRTRHEPPGHRGRGPLRAAHRAVVRRQRACDLGPGTGRHGRCPLQWHDDVRRPLRPAHQVHRLPGQRHRLHLRRHRQPPDRHRPRRPRHNLHLRRGRPGQNRHRQRERPDPVHLQPR